MRKNILERYSTSTRYQWQTENKKELLLILLVGVFLISTLCVFRTRMESFFFSRLEKEENIETKILKDYLEASKPLRNWQVNILNLGSVKSAISVQIGQDNNSKDKVLFGKDTDKVFPIASLTKLMTAVIALENYELDQKVIISKTAALKEGEPNFFKQGEVFFVEDLLRSSLIESSNKASQALAEITGEADFVYLMNKKANELGLQNTQFFNPTGLDPDEPQRVFNYSTAEDLVVLSQYILKKPFILETLGTKETNLYHASGGFHHKAINTNELLPTMSEIVAGKTGHTPLAKKCLLAITEAPRGNGYLVNIILGSQDNFGEMKKIIDWTSKAYHW